MIITPILSQRDSRWGWKKLGFSDASIADYGCVLTCITALAGKTDVGEVNEIMKSKGNYYQGSPDGAYADNLVVWANVTKVLPQLKFNFRYYSYDNQKVADFIYNKKTPVIVQVDATPIGAPRSDHYVLYVGDQKLMDPWTGRIRPTSDFPNPKGFILYELVDIYGKMFSDLKIDIDRLKGETDSLNSSADKKAAYNATMEKVKKIAAGGHL